MSKKRRVLAIDDNPVNLSILEEILGDEYRVRFAQSGLEAIRVAASFRPAFILLDVMMPEMDGLEICRQLRAMPALRNSIIIMVSAKAMPSEQVAGIDAGADDYITKPFDEVELVRALRRYTDPHLAGVDTPVWEQSGDEASVVS